MFPFCLSGPAWPVYEHIFRNYYWKVSFSPAPMACRRSVFPLKFQPISPVQTWDPQPQCPFFSPVTAFSPGKLPTPQLPATRTGLSVFYLPLIGSPPKNWPPPRVFFRLGQRAFKISFSVVRPATSFLIIRSVFCDLLVAPRPFFFLLFTLVVPYATGFSPSPSWSFSPWFLFVTLSIRFVAPSLVSTTPTFR